jgi:hypothetical protein
MAARERIRSGNVRVFERIGISSVMIVVWLMQLNYQARRANLSVRIPATLKSRTEHVQ